MVKAGNASLTFGDAAGRVLMHEKTFSTRRRRAEDEIYDCDFTTPDLIFHA